MKSSSLFMPLYLGVAILLFAVASPAQDAPMRIIEQPKPERPKDYGTLDAFGVIRLRIEFREDRQIGRIIPVSRLDVSRLTELAIEAAKRIKFEPELKDGRPVTVSKTVEYAYGWELQGWRIPTRPEAKFSEKQMKDAEAEAILKKAVDALGGDKYVNVKTQIGRGKYSIIKDGVIASFQTFIDVIVYPDKERTEFKGGGVKSVQTNTGSTGWVFDGDMELIKVQTQKQIDNFKRGIRTSLDHLLRGHWRGQGTLSYIGKRPGTLGKRNDVVKLTFDDGLIVEFEFSDDGLPQKAIYTTTNSDGEGIKEEDRYAQFVETGGIKAPYIVDHTSNGIPVSRINYELIEYNKTIPDSIFEKPSNIKEMKKDLKL